MTSGGAAVPRRTHVSGAGPNYQCNDDQTNHSAYNETVSKKTIHGLSFESKFGGYFSGSLKQPHVSRERNSAARLPKSKRAPMKAEVIDLS